MRRQLRAVPSNGFGFGALRYLGSPAARERLAAGPGPQIAFNYLGQFDGAARDPGTGLYRAVHSSIGRNHSPAEAGAHLLEILGDRLAAGPAERRAAAQPQLSAAVDQPGALRVGLSATVIAFPLLVLALTHSATASGVVLGNNRGGTVARRVTGRGAGRPLGPQEDHAEL